MKTKTLAQICAGVILVGTAMSFALGIAKPKSSYYLIALMPTCAASGVLGAAVARMGYERKENKGPRQDYQE